MTNYSKIIPSSIMILLIAVTVLFSGCGGNDPSNPNNNVVQGPGTGGTGPFVTSTTEQILAYNHNAPTPAINGQNSSGAGNNLPSHSNLMEVTKTNQDVQSTGGSDSKDYVAAPPPKTAAAPTTSSPSTMVPVPIKSTKIVSVLKKSVDNQVCAGFLRNINLMDNNRETNKLILTDNRKIKIQTKVTNPLSKTLEEVKTDCASYQLKDGYGNSIASNMTKCGMPEVILVFPPQKTHKYNLNIEDLPNGNYKIEYANQAITSSKERKNCSTFIDINIANQ